MPARSLAVNYDEKGTGETGMRVTAETEIFQPSVSWI
jgi:hypothetical protein